MALAFSREYAYGWVQLCKFRVITIYPVTALAAVALVSNSLHNVVWPVLSILFASIGVYMANDVFDLELDKMNSPERPLPRGLIGIRTVEIATVLSVVAAVAVALLSLRSLLFVALFVGLGLAYSVPPIRLRRFVMVPYLVVGVFGFSSFMTGASWVVGVDGRMVLVGLVMFAVYLGSCLTKEFKDVVGDRDKGLMTLPVVLGVNTAAKVSVTIILTVNFLLLIPYFVYRLSLVYPVGFGVLYSLLLLNGVSFLRNPADNRRARRYLLNSVMIGITQYGVMVVSALVA